MSAAGRRAWGAYNSGTYAAPTWVAFGRISEVSRPQSRSTSDRMFRGAKNKKKVTGYMEFGVTFKYHAKKAGATDTVLAKLEDSFINESVLDCIWLDQPLVAPSGSSAIGTTAKGIRGPYVVAKFDRDEADEDGVSYDVELVEVDHEEASALVETVAFSATVTV
jgi:hypothetical protein